MAKTTKKKSGRPYSMAFTAKGTPRRYLLSGIPAQLWIKVQAQAKREEIAVRQVILSLLEGWLLSRDPKTQVANAVEAARRAHGVGRKAPARKPVVQTELTLPFSDN